MRRDEQAPPSRLGRRELQPFLHDEGLRDGPPWARSLFAASLLPLGLGLAWAVSSAPAREPLLPRRVAEELARSGVSNPVTAVLLNFRAYDTLLEVAVLVVAMIGVWSLDRGSRRFGRAAGDVTVEPVLAALVRVAVPLIWLTAVVLVWGGSTRPGGAFQAAALLGGAGVLLSTAGYLRPPTADSLTIRAAAALGLFAFVSLGVGSMPWTGALLAYPEGRAAGWILGLEVLLTLSIAVVLVELFVDVPSVPARDPSLERVHPTGDPLGRALANPAAAPRPAGEGPAS